MAMMGADPPRSGWSTLVQQVRLHDAVAKLRQAPSPMRTTRPDELDAAITHWLADPSAVPPMASGRDVAAWRDIIDPETISWSEVPFAPVQEATFTFVDLFAGIGGFRLAMQGLGGRCVFSSEWNSSARETYYSNFGEVPYGDIAQFTTGPDEVGGFSSGAIPDHDVLCGGFPCQPFSLAGVSARNSLGRSHGFACETQGTAFFHIAQIIRAKRPRAVILENVRNFESHDHGRTLDMVKRVLGGPPVGSDPGLGYHLVPPFLLNSSTLVPQRRVRLFIVAFREAADAQLFTVPQLKGAEIPLRSIIDAGVLPEYTISDRLWQGHLARSIRNRAAGKGFVTGEADLDRPARTLVSRYGKDGKECLIPQGEDRNPRMLTPDECRQLMGFPREYVLPKSRSAAYRQFGNAVVVPVVERVGEAALSTWIPITDMPWHVERIRQHVLQWGEQHFQSFAWRTCDDPWHALLAEVLLVRTHAPKVEQVWCELVSRWPSPHDLAEAPPEELAAVVRSLGLTARFRQLQALAAAVTDGIPTSHAELTALPGVGDYVAAAYRSLRLSQCDVMLDANIVRWLCRLNGWEYGPEARRETRVIKAAERLTPTQDHCRYNYSALDFAMQVCLSRQPRCEACELSEICRFAALTLRAAAERPEMVVDMG